MSFKCKLFLIFKNLALKKTFNISIKVFNVKKISRMGIIQIIFVLTSVTLLKF